MDNKDGSQRRPLALLSDVHGWAFWQNMDDLAITVADEYDPRHVVLVDSWVGGKPPTFTNGDVVFRCYHRSEGVWSLDHVLPWKSTLGSLRSSWFWPENRQPPGQREYDLVNRYAGFQVVTQDNYRQLAAHCPNVRLLTNPVRMDRFTPTTVSDHIVASWNGNARHFNAAGEDVKGFSSIVVPACKAAGIPLISAEYNVPTGPGRRRQPAEMPAFYAKANVALIASLYEGSSNSFKEAMAAGLAVITTNCGDAMETYNQQIDVYGESGLLIVERSVDMFTAALGLLKADPSYALYMGRINRQDVKDHWSWDVWKDRYLEFLSLAQ